MSTINIPMIITVWGSVAVASSAATYFVALRKRLDAVSWAGWAFLLPPVLLLALLSPRQSMEAAHARKMRRALRDAFSDD